MCSLLNETSLECVFLLECALQVIVAVQMVVEEKFLTRYNVHALEAVGWEGKCSKVGSIL